MYKYQGNTGRYVWVPDPASQTPAPSGAQSRGGRQSAARRSAHREESPETGKPLLTDLGGGISDFLSKVFPDGFEMEDALLLLVLFLMYRETGDKDLLIIMGAMFLL